jgi:hypothetical protein
MKKNSISPGFVTLMAVIVMGAVSVIITVSVLLLGIDASRTSFTNEQSNQAKALANLCMEDALKTIDDTTGFTGTVNLSAGQGDCTYTVTDLGLENRIITASGTVGTVIRKITVSINDINPTINVTSWQEVP